MMTPVLPDDLVPLRAVESVIDTLNHAVTIETRHETIRYILQRLQTALGRQTFCMLCVGLSPQPNQPSTTYYKDSFYVAPDQDNPILLNRFFSDEASAHVLSHLLLATPPEGSEPRLPTTTVFSDDLGPDAWSDHPLLKSYLAPLGYADLMCSFWPTSSNVGVILGIARRENEQPFTPYDRVLLELFLRASTPIVDRHFIEDHPLLKKTTLSDRQREILLALLCGDSEKEIAHRLYRSVHTVHTYVKQLYSLFDVSSRGELMAVFVDRTVLHRLKHASPSPT